MYELDRTVGRQLPDDGEPGYERSRTDEDPVVGSAGDQLGEAMEPGSDALDDAKQLEAVGRGFTAWPALGWQLPVEILEEVGRRADDPTVAHRGGGVARDEALVGPRPDALQERSRGLVEVAHDAGAEQGVLRGSAFIRQLRVRSVCRSTPTCL